MIAVERGTDVDADLLLQSASEGVLVTGTVTAPATGECARCLGPVETAISAEVLELYAYPASLTEQTSDEDEVYRVGVTRDGNDAVDVEPVLRDAIVLALPLTPLCRPDCPGLCVDCGEPLADLPADHSHEQLDPRFGRLAELRDTLTSDPSARTDTATTRRSDPWPSRSARCPAATPGPAVRSGRPRAVQLDDLPEPRLRPAQAAAHRVPQLRPVRRPAGPR